MSTDHPPILPSSPWRLRLFTGLLGITLLYCQTPLAQDNAIDENAGYECGIIDRQETRIGVDKGITGRCSNSNLAITCTLDEQSGWRCIGAGNSVSGFSLPQVIGEACECKPDPFLNNELGTEE